MLPAQVSYWTLQETKRHNLVSEDQGDRTITETIRSNKAREEENYRHNTATEIEAVRHNTVSEWETNRSNVARERETNRSNLAKEIENARHNRSAERAATMQANAAFSSASSKQREAIIKERAENRAQELHRYQKALATTSVSTPWIQAAAAIVKAAGAWK